MLNYNPMPPDYIVYKYILRLQDFPSFPADWPCGEYWCPSAAYSLYGGEGGVIEEGGQAGRGVVVVPM